TPDTSLQEIAMIKKMGVEFRCSVEVGKDISVSEIEAQFDAIFVGLGLGGGTRLGVAGEDLEGVVEALEFIEQIHSRPLPEVKVARRVAVIGGGNTAIDAVTQAKRLGAERAVLIYRRGQEQMPAYDFEQKLAKADGTEFMFDTVPVEVLSNGTGHLAGLRLA